MRVVLTILVSLFMLGCASHHPISKAPDLNSDYEMPKSELVEKYPDIMEYEKKWRGLSPNFPLEKDLVAKLGKPNKIERDWWSPIVMIGTGIALNAGPFTWAIILAIRPDTPKTYYFEKANYCVKASVDRSFISGYKQYMHSWNWDENSRECQTRL